MWYGGAQWFETEMSESLFCFERSARMAKQNQKRLLVTGASGFLGYRICTEARSGWRVFGMGHAHPVAVEGVEALSMDLTDAAALNRKLDRIQPQAVIHTAAVSQPEACQRKPETTRAVNVNATEAIGTWCARHGAGMVFTSTDLVFDGTSAPYAETDPVSPVNAYGRQKADAENRLQRVCPDAVICRMPLMFGHSPGTSGGFLGWMIRALEKGEPIRLFTDEYRTAVDTTSAARGLLLFTEQPAGIYHLGGRKRLSRYDMGRALVAQGGWNPSLLVPASVHDAETSAPRSPDVSLVSDKAYALGYAPEGFDTALTKVVRLWRSPPSP